MEAVSNCPRLEFLVETGSEAELVKPFPGCVLFSLICPLLVQLPFVLVALKNYPLSLQDF